MHVDDHEIHRFEDDGAPVPTVRIGIAPNTQPDPAPKFTVAYDGKPAIDPRAASTLKLVGLAEDEVEAEHSGGRTPGGIVLKDVRPARLRHERQDRVQIPADDNGPARSVRIGGGHGPVSGPSMLVGASGQPISAAPEPVELINTAGETLNALAWPDYLAWRKTKCRPFDYERGPRLATVVDNENLTEDERYQKQHGGRMRGQEEIDQAITEFIGEVAELGELFIQHGPTTFFGDARTKLIDECGDILFCGAWALDAWGLNPLSEITEDLELIRVTDGDELAALANILASNDPQVVLGNPRITSYLGGLIFNTLLSAQTNAGLLANAYKKLRYQRREQPVEKQVERIISVLFAVNKILIVANSSVEEAIKTNMRKLDARYPNGYQPGQGGGIRTGEGA
ncbi:hypothetical protein SAMN05444166_4212 [Singulisphaera sp. GP187]|uniref:hypothetical protein n=1 Tax=Singulisphaera sp. GP187 TaxID=1882752 RepID=UPI00092C97CA|nr:hypothetical protein [Singulisphaera sp. GP187]SIO37719.1 hypothetical protein SAMN05444166_4212 [Singulisphaera sp. GP187]